jgi:hypothetical protein
MRYLGFVFRPGADNLIASLNYEMLEMTFEVVNEAVSCYRLNRMGSETNYE